MSTNENYFRLTVRFTNGETSRFILREPIDTTQISDKSRFAVIRTYQSDPGVPPELFLASLADISFIKTDRIETKDMRHRVAGIASALTNDADALPNAMSTIEFL